MSGTRKTRIRGGRTGKRLKRKNGPANKKALGQVRRPGVLHDGEHAVRLDRALKGRARGIPRGEARGRGGQRPGHGCLKK